MRKLRIVELISLDRVIQHSADEGGFTRLSGSAGNGQAIFAYGIPARLFDLLSTQAFPSAILFGTYNAEATLKTG